jgi:tetratricopeptide (TPR) repeat protein
MGQIPDDPAQERDHMVQVCQDRIQSAKKAISEGHWGWAVLDLNYGASYAIEPALVTEVRQLYQECEKEGARQLALAKQDYTAEKYLPAIKSYEVISRTFGALPCSIQARAEMKAAQADPKAKSAVNEAQAAGRNDFLEATIASAMRKLNQPTTAPGATTMPTTSPAPLSPATAPAALSRAGKIKLLDIPRRVRVVDTLERLAKLCPLAPTGKAAAGDLEELQKDDSFWSTIKTYRDEKQIEQAFKKAELYEKQGLLQKAKEFYEQVATDYPQHPLGQRAHLAAFGIDMDLKAHATPAPNGR